MASFLSAARIGGERTFTAFFAAGLTVLLILGTTLIIDRQEIARYQEVTRTEVVERLAEVNARISSALERRISLVDGITNLASVQRRVDQATFESLARAIVQETGDINAVMLYRKREVTHLYPFRQDRYLDRAAIAALPQLEITDQLPRQDWLIGPTALLDGKDTFLIGHPIYQTPAGRPTDSGPYIGEGLLLLHVRNFLTSVGAFSETEATKPDNSSFPLAIALMEPGAERAQNSILSGDPKLFDKGMGVTQDVSVPGGRWVLSGMPTDGWPTVSPNSWWLRLAGIGFAAFFAGLVFLVIGGAATRIWYGGQMVIGFGIAWMMREELVINVLALQPGMVPTAYNVIATGWWLAVAFFLNSGLDALLWRRIAAKSGEPVPKFLTDMVAVGVYLAAIAIIVRYVYDESITGILATSGLFALVLGLSAQTTLGEAFAGIALALAPAYRRGQIVRIGDVSGKVVDMNWRSVTLRNADGNMITLPNSFISKAVVQNMTEPDGRQRIMLEFVADYHAPPAQVCEVVFNALMDCEELDPNTQPDVRLMSFAHVGAHYAAFIWVDEGRSDIQARKQANTLIWHALTNADIPFAFDRAAAYGELGGEDIPAARPRATWVTAAPRLRDLFTKSSLFSVLSPEEIDRLSRRLTARQYGPPQRIVTQGDFSQEMFVIARGEVIVTILGSDGTSQIEVSRLGPGEVFGGMSLLTGEARSATVRAASDLVVYVLDPEAMREIFTSRPQLTEAFAERILDFKQQNEMALAEHAKNRAENETSANLFDRIVALLRERWL